MRGPSRPERVGHLSFRPQTAKVCIAQPIRNDRIKAAPAYYTAGFGQYRRYTAGPLPRRECLRGRDGHRFIPVGARCGGCRQRGSTSGVTAAAHNLSNGLFQVVERARLAPHPMP